MRTDAEKQAFAMKCMEIEKAGGDVLGYVEVNWPSYSPPGNLVQPAETVSEPEHEQADRGKKKGGK